MCSMGKICEVTRISFSKVSQIAVVEKRRERHILLELTVPSGAVMNRDPFLTDVEPYDKNIRARIAIKW